MDKKTAFTIINNYFNSFEGASIVEFKDGLIIKIGEYKMDINKKYPYGKRSKVT